LHEYLIEWVLEKIFSRRIILFGGIIMLAIRVKVDQNVLANALPRQDIRTSNSDRCR